VELNGNNIAIRLRAEETMPNPPQFIIAGKLKQDYFITADNLPVLNILGGNLPYAAVGFKLWNKDATVGLMARVGEDYPQEWLESLWKENFDTQGITILPEAVDLRSFYAYIDKTTRITGEPIPFFSKLGIPFPKALLGYHDASDRIDSRLEFYKTSLRKDDIPDDYKNATAVHLCPIDYMTHSLLPAVFRQNGFTVVTLDPSPSYLNPSFWNEVPPLITGLTAFLPAEEDLRNLFKGQSDDLWEMAEAIAEYDCEVIVIKRGIRGQLIFDNGAKKRWEIPAYDSRLVNPTGVGDAFCGGFLAGYKKTFDPVEAALYGNIAASIISEGVGPFFALDVLPGLQEARLENLRLSIRSL
jgi:sugar/nucleoside kinase (ribokinase family)